MKTFLKSVCSITLPLVMGTLIMSVYFGSDVIRDCYFIFIGSISTLIINYEKNTNNTNSTRTNSMCHKKTNGERPKQPD